MKKKPSLKDIAKKLNVSPTTVSFVLNGKGREKKISEEVIKRVLDYSAMINYKPNQAAQSLRTGKTNIIVFMVEDISNYFFSKIARIIEDLAYKNGYKVLFCSNENDDKRSKELLDLFSDRQADGFIIIPSPGIKSYIKDLMDRNIPLVLFDRYFPELDTSYVVIDNEIAAKNATEHLINNGFRRIGFVTIDVTQNQMIQRESGYNIAMENAGLDSNVLKIPFGKINTQEFKKSLYKFIRGKKNLDAVFFSTNYLTQAGLEVFKDKDPKILEELGILAFDDNDFFKVFTPSISTVSQPLQEIGEELMQIILTLIKSDKTNLSTRKVQLKAELIVRNSSKVRI